jgi:hypothetical protein
MRTKKFINVVLVSALFLSLVSIHANAAGGGNGRFSVGAELGLPMGDFGDAASTGFGGSLRYEMPMGDNLGLTATAGYLMFSGKTVEGVDMADWSMIPVQIGAKYYFQEQQTGFYGHVMIGIHSSTVKTPEYTIYGITIPSESVSETDFSYAPEVGYHLANIDIGLRYQMIATTGSTTSYLGLRLAYVFGEK